LISNIHPSFILNSFYWCVSLFKNADIANTIGINFIGIQPYNRTPAPAVILIFMTSAQYWFLFIGWLERA